MKDRTEGSDSVMPDMYQKTGHETKHEFRRSS